MGRSWMTPKIGVMFFVFLVLILMGTAAIMLNVASATLGSEPQTRIQVQSTQCHQNQLTVVLENTGGNTLPLDRVDVFVYGDGTQPLRTISALDMSGQSFGRPGGIDMVRFGIPPNEADAFEFEFVFTDVPIAVSGQCDLD